MLRGILICVSFGVCCAAAASAQTEPEPDVPPPPPLEFQPRTQPPAASEPAQEGPVNIPIDQMTPDQIMDNAAQLAANGQLQSAAQMLTAILQRDDRNIRALWMMGQVHEQAQDLQSARTYYNRVLALDKHHFQANLALGRTYVRQGVASYGRQAVAYLEKALQVAPANRAAEALGLLAQAYLIMNNRTRALDAAQKARSIDSNNIDAWNAILSALIASGRYDEALTESARYIDLTGRMVESQRGSQSTLQLLERAYQWREQALYQYHRSLYEQSRSRVATERLLPGNERKAADTLRQLIEVMQYHGELRRSLALFEIIPIAERAVSYDPTNPAAVLQLARLYRDTFQDARAARAYAELLKLDPENTEARDAAERLGVPAELPDEKPAAAFPEELPQPPVSGGGSDPADPLPLRP